MRLLLIAVLILAANSVRAEWVKVAESSDADYFSDPATIRKNGDLRRIWEVENMKVPKEFVSARALQEYDCQEGAVRRLAYSDFSGRMATGTVLYSSDRPGPKRYVAPGSVNHALFTFACAQ